MDRLLYYLKPAAGPARPSKAVAMASRRPVENAGEVGSGTLARATTLGFVHSRRWLAGAATTLVRSMTLMALAVVPLLVTGAAPAPVSTSSSGVALPAHLQDTGVSAGTISTLAGAPLSGKAAAGTAIAGPAMAATPPGISPPEMFVTDASYGVVYEVNPIATVALPAGTASIFAAGGANPASCAGSVDAVGDGCTAISAQLDDPRGVAVDASGDVFIADQAGQRIRMVAATNCVSACPYGLASTTAGDIYTVAGNGTPGYSGDGGPAGPAQLDNPSGVAVDASGNLLIADTANNRIRMVAAASCASKCPYGLSATVGGSIYTVAGGGTGGLGDAGPAVDGKLNQPEAVSADAGGNLLIADTNDHRIRMIAVADCTSSCPYGLASTTAGDIYTVAGDGTRGYSGDGGPAGSAELNGPAGVALDAGGNLMVADTGNNRIRLVAAASCSSACPYGLTSTTAGDIYTVAGDGTPGYSGDGGPARSATLANPHVAGGDALGDLLVADTNGNRIRLVAAASCSSACPYGLASTTAGDIYTVAGDGTPGYSGDGGPAGSAELSAPYAVAAATSGNQFVADANRIRLVAAASCSSACPYGLASTTAGDIYTVAGNGTPGYSGDGGPARLAELDNPTSVAVDAAGNLLIADQGNQRIRLIAVTTCVSACPYGLASTTAGDIYTVAGNGTPGYSGDGGPARSAALANPQGVAVDASGNLLIADTGNQRTRLVAGKVCMSGCPYGLTSTTVGDIYTVTGNGTPGYSGDGGPAGSAAIAWPDAVSVDPDGDLLVVDSGNNRIRLVAATSCPSGCPYGLASTTAGDIYTVAGGGTGGLGDGGPAVSGELNQPQDVSTDVFGDILIADWGNNRIRLVAATSCPSGCPYGLASTTAGDIYTVAGDGTQGYSGDGGAATSAELSYPQGVVVTAAGDLLIADFGNKRVRQVTGSGLVSSGSSYTSLNPFRIVDTRCAILSPPAYCSGENLPAKNAALSAIAAGASQTVTIDGTGSGTDVVPQAGVTAVVANMTVDDFGGNGGYLRAYATGGSVPPVSAINWRATSTGAIANLATIPVSSGGTITVANGGGTGKVDYQLDIQGYYSAPSPGSTTGLFNPLSPARLADTRCLAVDRSLADCKGLPVENAGLATIAGGTFDAVSVDGLGGLPLAGVAAVVLNLTATDTGAGNGYFSVYPAGQNRAEVSNLNWDGGEAAVPNRVTVEVGASGKIDVFSSIKADVIVDLSGYYTGGSAKAQTGSLFNPINPTRYVDTRCSTSSTLQGCAGISALSPADHALHPIPARGTDMVAVGGVGSDLVPAGATAFVGNLTAVGPADGGFLSVNPVVKPPTTSDVNFAAGETVANMIVGGLDPLGEVVVYNSASGATGMILDVSGYFGPVV